MTDAEQDPPWVAIAVELDKHHHKHGEAARALYDLGYRKVGEDEVVVPANPEPDMWWDYQDPEVPFEGPEDWAAQQGVNAGEIELVEFSTGFRGSDRHCVIEGYAPHPDTDDVEYRIHFCATREAAQEKRDELRAMIQAAPKDRK